MVDKYDAIMIFGPPGVGKGTQSKILHNTGEYFHFSTGDMFRELIKIGVPLAVKAKEEYWIHGNLAPDDWTMQLFDEALERKIENMDYNPTKQYLLLDGIPRNEKQVELMDKRVDIKRILYLDTPHYICKKRMLDREREDDTPETIENRFEVYENETIPMIGMYNPSIIEDITGSETIEQVTKLCLESLKEI